MKVLLTLLFAVVSVSHFGPVQPQSAKVNSIFSIHFAPIKIAISLQFPIQVYYESLCPDSVRFIKNQLYPSYRSLKDYVDVLFVPFGKSESVSWGIFLIIKGATNGHLLSL